MSPVTPAVTISIAAPPGGGKTTLSRLLAAKLGDVPILHFDDYEAFTRRGPAEVEAWLSRGAPIGEIAAPGFAEELARLRRSGARHVVVDAPVGRAHPATAAMIDVLIFLDTPLDIALARVIHHQASLAAQSTVPAAARDFTSWLEGYLRNYAGFMRRTYDVQRATVMPQADLVLDGTLTPERLVELALPLIVERTP